MDGTNNESYQNQNQPRTGQKSFDKTLSPILVCTIMTVLVIIALVVGFAIKSPLVIALFLLPVVAYEVYRTRGEFTTLSAWVILIVLIVEIILILFHINYDLGRFLNLDSTYVGGQYIPIGDVKILGPTLLAVFSIVLLIRTYGPYTKWLSILIFGSAFVMVYIMNPNIFNELLRNGIQRLFWYF